jgi:YfiH family protein
MIQATTIHDSGLSGLDAIDHRFFTRRGGVSDGLYSSLNCGYGSGDSPDNVRENRRRAAETFALGETDLLTLHQIHSTDVLAVGAERWTSPGAPKADGLVTNRPGVALGVLAADCAPVLLADNRAGVIGAAHAGWKGALGGVVEATIAAMEKLGARRESIRAAIGPCIGRDTYEVGPEFPAPFLKQDEANSAYFKTAPRAGHFIFDLAGYLLRRIAAAGVTVRSTGHDTLGTPDDFFSYRRNTLQGVRDYGRGLSAIALKGARRG